MKDNEKREKEFKRCIGCGEYVIESTDESNYCYSCSTTDWERETN